MGWGHEAVSFTACYKTFRYGLIVLGFFLVMIGMFIMSVDKPQIYITFCTLGSLIIAAGIIWSMCQCYPKIRVVSVDAESEKFLVKKAAASSVENEIPEKKSFQTSYTSQKEADFYEKSLPSYEQIQMKVASTECLGVLSAPVPPARVGGSIQPVVQARAEVHRDSESDGDASKDPPSQGEAASLSCQSERFQNQAPLASFQEEVDTSSVESTSNSPFLQKWKDVSKPMPPTESQLRFKLPSYEDFALIDSLMVEGQGRGNERTMAPNQTHCPIPATGGDGALATVGPGPLEHRAIENVEEDDMYYGIKEGPGNFLSSVGAVSEPKD
ncbi:barttin isoform X2 [Rhineura floridana]|uniref:barttin isoform X2 n=1 Tax=Rhineura floridana TaxID=261503 RepID=UPI002AC7EC66|nr:barttin isoform X2 [Rhineura floridana]